MNQNDKEYWRKYLWYWNHDDILDLEVICKKLRNSKKCKLHKA